MASPSRGLAPRPPAPGTDAPPFPQVAEVAEFLAANALCATLAPNEVAEIVFAIRVQPCAAGERVVAEGAAGDAWFLVHRGTFAVRRGARLLDTLGPGQVFGEMAALDGDVRSASVDALEAGILFRFGRRDFDGLLASGSLAAHKVVLALTRLLAQRLRQLLRDGEAASPALAPDAP